MKNYRPPYVGMRIWHDRREDGRPEEIEVAEVLENGEKIKFYNGGFEVIASFKIFYISLDLLLESIGEKAIHLP